jgi:hypothetical protein
MFKENYSNGAQLFSTGDSLLLNWSNSGMVFEHICVVDVKYEFIGSSYSTEYVDVLTEKGQIQKPIRNKKVTLTLSVAGIKENDTPFLFEELLKKDLKIEDFLKIIYSTIEKN